MQVVGCLPGSTDPVAGSNGMVRCPSGAVAGEMSHFKNRPLPAAPTNSPASATTSPRTSVVIGQPLMVLIHRVVDHGLPDGDFAVRVPDRQVCVAAHRDHALARVQA